MKKALSLAISLLLLSTAPALAGHYGPAQPAGQKGQMTLGTGIHSYNGEWDGNVKAEQIQAYAQFGYVASDNLELYLQAGAADLTVEDFEDGYRPFATAGFRMLISDRAPFAIGIFGQGSYFSNYEDKGVGGNDKIEFVDSYELSGGVALQTWLEGALLYGGPLFYIREGDIEVTSGAVTAKGSFEDQSNVGGFVGIRWPLDNGINIELESQFKSKVSVGGAVTFCF